MKRPTIPLVLALLAASVNAQPTLQLSVQSQQPIALADLAQVIVQCTNVPANTTLWPALDGLLWGAQHTLNNAVGATPQTVTLYIPMVDSGSHSLQVFALPAGAIAPSSFPTGQPAPAAKAMARSNVASVSVAAYVAPPPHYTNNSVAMEWEPWFTPSNDAWQLAEAVPLCGYYNSTYDKVIKLHALWLAQAGVDYIMVDWTNNLWNVQHWSDRGVYAQELINATIYTFEVYAQLRAQGIRTPNIALLTGLDNGPSESLQCFQEELDYITQTLLPQYRSLFQTLDGKPLLLGFDGSSQFNRSSLPVSVDAWTYRWMASQLQNEPQVGTQKGYWSWMDGTMEPVATTLPPNGPGPTPAVKNEALTVTCAYFAGGGWLAQTARGKRQGATWLQQMAYANSQARPQMLVVNQWNEYAGQPTAPGQSYVDIYNSTLGNDMEPTSLTECAYSRPNDARCGGWGMYYLNALRATVDIFRGVDTTSTLLAVAQPLAEQVLTSASVVVEWYTMGHATPAVQLAVDGRPVANTTTSPYTLDLSAFAGSGAHNLSVTVIGATTRYALSLTSLDKPSQPMTSVVTLPLVFAW